MPCKSQRLLLSVIAIMAPILLQLGCGEAGPAEPDDQPPAPGSVRGVLTDVVTSRPIAAALVVLTDGAAVTDTNVTTANGAFSFADLEVGGYDLSLVLPVGYEHVGAPTIQVQVSEGSATDVPLQARAVQAATETVQPGTVDTLATAAGGSLEIDASSFGKPVDVSISNATSADLDALGLLTGTVRFRIAAEGGPASPDPLSTAAVLDGKISASLSLQTDAPLPGGSQFVFDVGDGSEPLLLYADATSTTFIDPNTGLERTVAKYSFETTAAEPLDALASVLEEETECAERRIEALNGDITPDGRIPLILVHGWQAFKTRCPLFEPSRFSGRDRFEEFITHQASSARWTASLEQKYKTYVVTYPSFEPLLATSAFLYDELARLGLSGAVLIGHSAGGLVGRGLLALEGGPAAIRALLTLGTPHYGSPLADYSAAEIAQTALANCRTLLTASALALLNGAAALGELDVFTETDGFHDLGTGSQLVSELRNHELGEKVFTYGGVIEPGQAFISLPDRYQIFACALNHLTLSDTESDGIVSTTSATPSWSLIRSVFPDHNHDDVKATESVFREVDAALESLASCEAAPDPPGINSFSLSGAFARIDERTIGVTLNPIVINDELVTDLTSSNIRVVEDGCLVPIEAFRTDNIGVDIVFAQDLSGSMFSAIEGVRSSVIDFAADLGSRGLNVSIGSVGYSQPGTIPSSPASSTCEYLGPFQDLTDPTTFQSHVRDSWYASDGCDLPENGLEAIEYAHENVSWRSGAVRHYIDITDVSHHWSGTSCNGLGPCSDQTVESIVSLVGDMATIHVVAPSDPISRTLEGGVDPWLLADGTGGTKLDLGSGYVDLTNIGLADVIGETVSFTFNSASTIRAFHTLRIQVEIEVGGQTYVSELSPGMIQYAPLDASLVPGG